MAREDHLLLGLVLAQMILMVLFVPGVAAVALTSEKEGNTLEMLYASRLKPHQIICGKIGLAVAYPLMLLGSSMPFVALLYYRGGVRPDELLWSYLLLLESALFLAILSLAVSAVCRHSATALVITYALVLALCGAVLVPAAIMLQMQSGLAAQALHYIRGLSPVGAVLSLLRPEMNDLAGRAHANLPIWEVFIPLAALLMLGSFAVVVLKLRRAPFAGDQHAPARGAETKHTLGRRVMYLIDPKKKRKPIGRWNPLIVKERRTSMSRSGTWTIRIFYGSLLLSLGLAAMSLYGGPEHADLLRYVALVMVSFQLGVIALVAPSLTTATISSELENGTWEMLRLTPMKGGQIFWGKFIPAIVPALLPVLALAPAYGALVFIAPGYGVRLMLLLPIVLLAVVFCCVLGLACSSWTANAARAAVAAYGITAALFVLPLFGWLMMGQQLSPRGGALIAFASPIAMGLNLLPDSSPELMRLYGAHLGMMGTLCLLLLVASRARLAMLLRQG
jgi:ABC-type transport system involved in multi-copper enzyme maturation permease subunit